jgi:hypothetical protein
MIAAGVFFVEKLRKKKNEEWFGFVPKISHEGAKITKQVNFQLSLCIFAPL